MHDKSNIINGYLQLVSLWPYLLAVLFKEPQLKALVQLHLFVLPELMSVRVRGADGRELRANGPRRAAMAGHGRVASAAAATTRLGKRRLRRLQALQNALTYETSGAGILHNASRSIEHR